MPAPLKFYKIRPRPRVGRPKVSMGTITLEAKSQGPLNSIENAHKIFKEGMRQGLFGIGRENVRHIRYLYRLPKTGKWYFKPDKKTPHRASAPGQPPAVWSGYLYQTMKYVVRGHDEMEFGDRPFYGTYLEQGTKDNKLKARPHLRRTVLDREKDNELILSQAIDRELKKHAR